MHDLELALRHYSVWAKRYLCKPGLRASTAQAYDEHRYHNYLYAPAFPHQNLHFCIYILLEC
jgi:hypothetical protein